MARPTTSATPGPVVGGALGAAAGGPIGALVGAWARGAIAGHKLRLEDAIRKEVEKRGLIYCTMQRRSKLKVSVLVQTEPGKYWTIEGKAPKHVPYESAESLDDALFDATVEALNQWSSEHRAA